MSTPVRYFTDEHVAKAVAGGLRKRSIDVLTIAEAGLLGADDEDLLAFGREEKRVLVTQDRDVLRIAVRERVRFDYTVEQGVEGTVAAVRAADMSNSPLVRQMKKRKRDEYPARCTVRLG
jgi:predicted nuclease of predicted toxin-antitoxin system